MSVDLWIMAGEAAETDASEHKLALARVACASYWPVVASAITEEGLDHAKALISEGVTAAVADIATSPADQAILATRVLDSFNEDWQAHHAVVDDAPGYGEQMGFGFPAEQDSQTDQAYQDEITAWRNTDHQTQVDEGNGIGISDDSSGPNVTRPGQNAGQPPVLHPEPPIVTASLADIEAGLAPGDYRLDAFGALIPVRREAKPAGGGRIASKFLADKAPYYIREEGGSFKVVNRDGEVKGTFPSKEKARQQQKALYVNVPDASDKAEKVHGHTPEAVSDVGKKATRHTARELRCTKCKAEVSPEDIKGTYGQCSKGGRHTPEWGPDKEASLSPLQRQAVRVAHSLVDQMPIEAQHHAVAKAMLMRARGFNLTDDETDLVITAALNRVNERLQAGGSLDFTKQAGYDDIAAHLHRMNHGDRTRYESEGHPFEVSYHERPAYGDMGQPVEKSDMYSGTTGEYTLYHPHGQAQEFHVGPSVHAKGYQAEKVRDAMMDTWSKKKMNRLMSQGNLHTADGVSQEKRDRAEKAGDTLPGTDKFPITNASDLAKAKHDIGRTNEPHDKVVRYIDRKAEELGEPGVGEDDDDKSKKASMQKGAPFAGYKNFQDCVKKNQDKGNPEAYCGKIKMQTEGSTRRKRLWNRLTGRRVTANNVHHFDSSAGTYGRTQTDDSIKDGDVFHIPGEGITGYMHSAWPVAVTQNKGEFHGLNNPNEPPEGEVDKECPTCHGSGEGRPGDNAPYRKPGDTTCWHCSGKGYFPGDPPERVQQWRGGWQQARDIANQHGYPLDQGGPHEASLHTAQGGMGGMSNPMDPSSTANPFSPAQDVNASMSDSNPDMGGQMAGPGGVMDPGTQPPDEIAGQTDPGSATGTAASSKPRTKPSSNPNAPNKPRPQQPMSAMPGMPGAGMGMPPMGGAQMMTGLPMMATRAQVIVAESILNDNPEMSEEAALHLAARTIDRYPHLVREAYGGYDFPFGDEDTPGSYSECPQCNADTFDGRSGHCHNCGYINGAGEAGFDPLVGPTTIRPGRADLRNPGTR
jgi:hypothetical protein